MPKPGFVVEVFGGENDMTKLADGKDLQLFGGAKWTLWEQREFLDQGKSSKNQSEENYERLLQRVAWFDNIIQFHQVWNRVPHSKINEILADTVNQ